MTTEPSSSSFSSSPRSWRTAFLTLRDETQTLVSPSPVSLYTLLHNLLFSQSDVLIAASPHLPPHEVTSDVILLVELSKAASEGGHAADTFLRTCDLVHDVSCRVRLDINSSSWAVMLEFLERMVHFFLGEASSKSILLENATSRMKVVRETLEILRHLVNGYTKCSLSERTQLVHFLLYIVTRCNTEVSSSYSSGNQRYNAVDNGSKVHKYHKIWEFQTTAFVMIGEALSSFGSSLPIHMWQSTLEVMRIILDTLVSKSLILEDSIISRFYTALLHCLHLVLSDPKESLSDHMAGLVAALKMFFVYGVTNRTPLVCPDIRFIQNEISPLSKKSGLAESARSERGPYRPPHLRKREVARSPSKARDTRNILDNDLSACGFTSSESEHSDSDGSGKDLDSFRSSKTRIAAFVCIQDLCQADPKALSAHWTSLLPTNNVLQPRKYEADLMTCLLFDPVLKVRMASASVLAALLGGPSSVFLQVAEYKENARHGSFTALSSTLGQMLMQLHTGILYLVQHEAHNGLLVSLFRVLMLLIPATPYSRMPGELLPAVISSLSSRVIEGFPSRTDQTGLLAISLSCLGAAFSTSPPSLQVKEMLQEEISSGCFEGQRKRSVLSMIFQFSERRGTNPALSFEALQVLRAVSHNYPHIMDACWEHVSTLVHGLLRVGSSQTSSPESSARMLKGYVGNTAGSLEERCIMAAIKVLDECLRAISGFNGTEDLLDDRSLETAFTSDCSRTKRISSAPSYGLDFPELSESNLTSETSGKQQWSEAIEKHLPMVLMHSAAMVRAASVTCYAGITSSVFFSLEKVQQDFILSSSIRTALNDVVPSVRSAACRAIGVIACFPQISHRADILDKFINATEINTHDPLVSVRITASWALANICDLLRHRLSDSDSESDKCLADLNRIAILAECALRLSKDNDKVKSNAVRALGNLSRFVPFISLSTEHNELDVGGTSPTTDSISHNSPTARIVSGLASVGDPSWLGRMVQAFVSCVTTGNVKVQWNVCHALRNLFLNETLKLHETTWAPSVFSILLLLLRDSSNYKIRIHAAAALTVPSSRLDYGTSFSDVVQGLEHVLETLGSDRISAPSSFKYRDALEKQLTSSNLHVLGLASCSDDEPVYEFLVKKASFLEDWLKSLCSSLEDISNQPGEETSSVETVKDESLTTTQRKEILHKTIGSLIEVYRRSNHQRIAQRFEKLIDSDL